MMTNLILLLAVLCGGAWLAVGLGRLVLCGPIPLRKPATSRLGRHWTDRIMDRAKGCDVGCRMSGGA